MSLTTDVVGASCPSPFRVPKPPPLLLFLLLLQSLLLPFSETAGQLPRINPEKDTGRPVSEVCRQGTECVLGPEYCNINNLGLAKLQKCGVYNTLSKSVCCPIGKVVRDAYKRDRRTTTVDDDESDLDKALDRASPVPVKPLPEEPECGRNTKSVSKITSVQNAKASDWPWMAVFLETINYSNFCGGSLLNRRFVLTAAHCFRKYVVEPSG